MKSFLAGDGCAHRPHTPFSSGYHSSTVTGGTDSKMSSFLAASTPSASPTSSSNGSRVVAAPATTARGRAVPTSMVEEATIYKLRQEIEALKNTFVSSQKRWSEVRSALTL